MTASSDPSEPADSIEAIRSAVARLTRASAAAQSAAAQSAAVRSAAVQTGDVGPAVAPAAPEGLPAAPSGREAALADAVRRVEAVLFASAQPVEAEALAALMPEGVAAGEALMRLKALYRGRGVQLVELAGKWRFQTAPDLAHLFHTERAEQRTLSRAAMETLAIVAYCQPLTRAEIEEVRGVAVSKGTLDVLMEAGWIRPRGRRRTPGRPATYGTTEAFLVHFGLDAVESLPGRSELRAAGLLSADAPAGFAGFGMPGVRAPDELIEDPYEEGPDFHVDFTGEGEGAEEAEGPHDDRRDGFA